MNKITVTSEGIHNADYVNVPCPTCKRKGTVNDPEYFGKPVSYYDRKGNRCPQVVCRTCNGEGWILKPISQI